ncbi:MAG: hypothetical protein BWK80_41120 [Desulfobacteraceae bacterium IS3]|nr:MAG: hypothetical protein BWK80_41120 [Desulfobacteraceae bacterium IS3]
MVKKLLLLVLAVLIILPTAANAAEFKQGNRTFTLSGGGTSDKNFDSSSVSVEAHFGYFTRNNWELSFRQKIGYMKQESSVWDFTSRMAADYYLDTVKFQGRLSGMKAFAGASVGYQYDDSLEGNYIAGPEVGLKLFFNETTFATVMIAYNFSFEGTDDADDSFKDGRFDYTFGIGFKF